MPQVIPLISTQVSTCERHRPVFPDVCVKSFVPAPKIKKLDVYTVDRRGFDLPKLHG